MSIVLASASLRRAELLQQLQLEFTIAPMDVDETGQGNEHASEYVQRIAESKATAACQKYSKQDVIIAADTVVCVDSTILGKPVDRAHGMQMLACLSGRTHIVFTAVVVSQADYIGRALSETEVTFRKISRKEMQKYWYSGEPQDKAGGYAIQGLGAMFVAEIRGSYTGVVGLPLYELTQLLRKTSVQLLE